MAKIKVKIYITLNLRGKAKDVEHARHILDTETVTQIQDPVRRYAISRLKAVVGDLVAPTSSNSAVVF